MTHKDINPSHTVRLINADIHDVVPLGITTMKVKLGNLETDQDLAVMDNLSAPVIIGCDFLKREDMFIISSIAADFHYCRTN